MKISLKVAVIAGFIILPVLLFFAGTPFSVAQNRPDPPKGESNGKIRLECSGCHGPGTTLPNLAGDKFHKEPHREYDSGVHAKIQADGKPAASCVDCHTIMGDMATDLPPDNPKSTVFATNQEQTCGKCHQEALTTFGDSIHGSLLEGGDVRAASCSDCHGNHAIQPGSNKDSSLYRTHVTQICIKCHTGVVADYESSAHGQLYKKGDPRGPICTDCHAAVSHYKAPATRRDFTLLMVDKCSSCHIEQAPTYRDTFHGQAAAFGFKPSATCADCHTPHKNLPASDPKSSVNPKNLVQTCAQCHVDANPSFATYNPHPEPENPDKGYLTYVVYTFMNWLLFGVFGFFTVHTVLWLQRSIVSLIRGESHKRIRDEEEQWVLRFSKPHRFTHLLIIVSFLGLAATGLPLMYSFSDWGQWLVGLHGGLEVTRFLHRVCAVITFFYAGYHLWMIIKGGIVNRNWSVFWGPESMMIRPRDFTDAFNMFRWFFYLGPKPELDRFTYWEKFDYFAVFWGVPVIGLSGLVLWFPTFFTLFLPGEALNVAMIIHSEEALLATAFIFAFHFFHNHLRPENFPMDIVMFTGKVRLSWFKEERRAEYDRLVEEGKLDSIIVPPPSLRFRVLARIFGFIAYFTGLFLVIAIFVTLFTAGH
ncbi:MAG: hypothetical protein IPM63_10070 [Acidobacteriota bacterium]|nr:MAG: hypothetical protein IPM63_10070 [Acidobacteriota bacterium]